MIFPLQLSFSLNCDEIGVQVGLENLIPIRKFPIFASPNRFLHLKVLERKKKGLKLEYISRFQEILNSKIYSGFKLRLYIIINFMLNQIIIYDQLQIDKLFHKG